MAGGKIQRTEQTERAPHHKTAGIPPHRKSIVCGMLAIILLCSAPARCGSRGIATRRHTQHTRHKHKSYARVLRITRARIYAFIRVSHADGPTVDCPDDLGLCAL